MNFILDLISISGDRAPVLAIIRTLLGKYSIYLFNVVWARKHSLISICADVLAVAIVRVSLIQPQIQSRLYDPSVCVINCQYLHSEYYSPNICKCEGEYLSQLTGRIAACSVVLTLVMCCSIIRLSCFTLSLPTSSASSICLLHRLHHQKMLACSAKTWS